MCRNMVDIQSPTAEIRRGKKRRKKKKKETGWKYIWSALLHRAIIKWSALLHRATINNPVISPKMYRLRPTWAKLGLRLWANVRSMASWRRHQNPQILQRIFFCSKGTETACCVRGSFRWNQRDVAIWNRETTLKPSSCNDLRLQVGSKHHIVTRWLGL